jgi:hypothetical protein
MRSFSPRRHSNPSRARRCVSPPVERRRHVGTKEAWASALSRTSAAQQPAISGARSAAPGSRHREVVHQRAIDVSTAARLAIGWDADTGGGQHRRRDWAPTADGTRRAVIARAPSVERAVMKANRRSRYRTSLRAWRRGDEGADRLATPALRGAGDGCDRRRLRSCRRAPMVHHGRRAICRSHVGVGVGVGPPRRQPSLSRCRPDGLASASARHRTWPEADQVGRNRSRRGGAGVGRCGFASALAWRRS